MTMSTIADGIGSDDSVGLVEFYDHVADFVAADMESIYQSIFTTVARTDIYGAVKKCKHIRCATGRKSLPSSYCSARRIGKVRNEQINLEDDEIEKFSDVIFAKYKSVSFISFYAINANIDSFSHPC